LPLRLSVPSRITAQLVPSGRQFSFWPLEFRLLALSSSSYSLGFGNLQSWAGMTDVVTNVQPHSVDTDNQQSEA